MAADLPINPEREALCLQRAQEVIAEAVEPTVQILAAAAVEAATACLDDLTPLGPVWQANYILDLEANAPDLYKEVETYLCDGPVAREVEAHLRPPDTTYNLKVKYNLPFDAINHLTRREILALKLLDRRTAK